MPTTSRRPSPEVIHDGLQKSTSLEKNVPDLNNDQDNSHAPHPPTPAPEDAAKFDAHDMMATTATRPEAPHIKPSRTITGEFGSRPRRALSWLGASPRCVGDEGLLLAIRSPKANHHRDPSRALGY